MRWPALLAALLALLRAIASALAQWNGQHIRQHMAKARAHDRLVAALRARGKVAPDPAASTVDGGLPDDRYRRN